MRPGGLLLVTGMFIRFVSERTEVERVASPRKAFTNGILTVEARCGSALDADNSALGP